MSANESGAGSGVGSRTGTAFLRAHRGSARLDREALVVRKRGSSLRIPVDVIDTVEIDGGIVRIRLLAESEAATLDLCVLRYVSRAEAQNFVAEVAAAIPVNDRVARLRAIADSLDDLHITRSRAVWSAALRTRHRLMVAPVPAALAVGYTAVSVWIVSTGRGVAIALWLIAPLPAGFALYTAASVLRGYFEGRKIRRTGITVRADARRVDTEVTSWSYRFTTVDGRAVTSYGKGGMKFSKGGEIDVVYDPADPQNRLRPLLTAADRWGIALLGTVIGLFLTAVGGLGLGLAVAALAVAGR